jgi:hypothetical protein
MSDIFQQAIVLISSLVIAVRAEPTLNRMCKCTPLMMRMAFHFLTLGAIAEIGSIFIGDVPSWSTAISTVGAATLLVCEPRLLRSCRLLRRKVP